MFFKIHCYIIDIKNNELIISIVDKDELNKFHKNLIKLYKNPNDFDLTQNIFKIKYNNQTKFEITFNYNNIKDLKGCSVIISGYSKYYCFSYNNEILDENTNLFKTEKKIKKGFTLLANKIIN
jgi:hypothetical protein